LGDSGAEPAARAFAGPAAQASAAPVREDRVHEAAAGVAVSVAAVAAGTGPSSTALVGATPAPVAEVAGATSALLVEPMGGDRMDNAGLDVSDESQTLDATQVPVYAVVDNEDGGETGGITGVMGTNVAAMGILMGSTTITGQIVGSEIVNTEIETRGALVHRQSIPKPANWKLMTKGQRTNWYKRKSD